MREPQPKDKHRWLWRSGAQVGNPTMYQRAGVFRKDGQRISEERVRVEMKKELRHR
jgi:hypothetical protein